LSDLQTPEAEFLLAYGRALLDDGRPAEACRPLERAVRLEPTTVALDILAEACDGLGDRARAVSLWEQAVARNPDDRAALEGLAQAALENRSPAEALRWLEPLLLKDDLHSSTAFLAHRAAKLSGDNEAAAKWTARANTLWEREKKIGALEQALRETPHAFWSRCVRAHRFASDGNSVQALVIVEELLKQNPSEPFVRQLSDALRRHTPLPPLESIPLEQF
jgi:predicted Zn-dependent protease